MVPYSFPDSDLRVAIGSALGLIKDPEQSVYSRQLPLRGQQANAPSHMKAHQFGQTFTRHRPRFIMGPLNQQGQISPQP